MQRIRGATTTIDADLRVHQRLAGWIREAADHEGVVARAAVERHRRQIPANGERVARIAAVDRSLVTDAVGEELVPGDLRSAEAVRRGEGSDHVGVHAGAAIDRRDGPGVVEEHRVVAAAGSDRERGDTLRVVDDLCNRGITREGGDGREARGISARMEPQPFCLGGAGDAQHVGRSIGTAVGNVDGVAGDRLRWGPERHVVGVGPAQSVERQGVGAVVQPDHVDHVIDTTTRHGRRPDDLVAGRGHVDRDRGGRGRAAVDRDRRAADAAFDQDRRGGRVGGLMVCADRDGLRRLYGAASLDREIVTGEQAHVAGDGLHGGPGRHGQILADATGIDCPQYDCTTRGGDIFSDRQRTCGRDHDVLTGRHARDLRCGREGAAVDAADRQPLVIGGIEAAGVGGSLKGAHRELDGGRSRADTRRRLEQCVCGDDVAGAGRCRRDLADRAGIGVGAERDAAGAGFGVHRASARERDVVVCQQRHVAAVAGDRRGHDDVVGRVELHRTSGVDRLVHGDRAVGGEGHRRRRDSDQAAHAADLDVAGVVDPEAALRDRRCEVADLGVERGLVATDAGDGNQPGLVGIQIARAVEIDDRLRGVDPYEAARGGDLPDEGVARHVQRHVALRRGGRFHFDAAERSDEHAAGARGRTQGDRRLLARGCDDEERIRRSDRGAGGEAHGLGRDARGRHGGIAQATGDGTRSRERRTICRR